MNLSQLQSFVALTDLGSFTEAAYSIGLTQSAVSHALAALEGELGVTLLERNRKGIVALTAVGQKIMPHVRALLAQAEAIEQEAKAEHGLAAGKLRLGSVLSLCPQLLAAALTRFQQQFPDIEVVLFEGTPQEVGDWIGNGVIDVGFVLHPTSGVESTPVGSDELFVVVPTGHRLSDRQSVAVAELAAEGLIMAKTGCAFQLMEMAGLEPNHARAQIRYSASDSTTIMAMVREGLGITIQPGTILPARLDGIVALALDPPGYLRIGLAVRAQETASPAARFFVKATLALTRTPARRSLRAVS